MLRHVNLLARLLASIAAILAFSTYAADVPAATADSPALHVDDSVFRACEFDAFGALVVARNAIWFKDKRANLLGIQSNDDDRRAMINAVFDEIELHGVRDHVGIAFQRFDACVHRASLPVGTLPEGGKQCLARQDIEFMAEADLGDGRPIDESRARIRKMLAKAPPSFYPDKMIDQVTSMVYLATDSDRSELIRQALFESCLFPQAFSAWQQDKPADAAPLLRVIGVSQVGPDVHSQPSCGNAGGKGEGRQSGADFVVVVARDPADFSNNEALLRRSVAAAEPFAQALAAKLCASGKSGRIVIDASPATDARTKFAQQARMQSASLVVLVESPISFSGIGKPGVDISATAIALDAHDGDATVRGTYDRTWPAWRDKAGTDTKTPSAMAGEFVAGMASELH